MEEQHDGFRRLLAVIASEAEWSERIKQAKTTEELINLYKERGIKLSQEDQGKFAEMLLTKDVRELSDEQLSQISGGFPYHLA